MLLLLLVFRDVDRLEARKHMNYTDRSSPIYRKFADFTGIRKDFTGIRKDIKERIGDGQNKMTRSSSAPPQDVFMSPPPPTPPHIVGISRAPTYTTLTAGCQDNFTHLLGASFQPLRQLLKAMMPMCTRLLQQIQD